MMRILLTGVAGFIGAHTLEHLLEKTDWQIVGIDSLTHRGDLRRISQVMAKNPSWYSRFTFFKYDLSWEMDASFISRLGDFDFIINMASESHVDRSITDPKPFIRNNVMLTVNMLELARIIQPDAFIQISTDEVYGPMYDEPYPEWSTPVPSNPYSASKASQEMIAISYWRTYGVPLVITNTMNNIGEMQDVEKFVPMLIRDISEGRRAQIHGTKEEIGSRFYLHARNHADALLYILQNTTPVPYNPQMHTRPDRWNIVGDTQLDNLEMAKRIAKILKKPLKYDLVDYHSTRPGHDMHYGLDGSKLEEHGWKPPLSFEDSLKRTVENYIEHKEWLQ